jgi:hypothetical protein
MPVENLFSEIPQPLQFSIKKKAPIPPKLTTTGTIPGPNSIKKAQAKNNKKKATTGLEDDLAPEHFMMGSNSQYISHMLSRTLF